MRGLLPVLLTVLTISAAAAVAAADEPAAAGTAEQLAFFESKIRPVLVAHCYQCHAAESKIVQGGLRLDSRAGLLAGGDSGPAISADDSA
ncbi:MAG: c-type cytochrome domain-containing protein, partial [Planctomycetaceae bacterium]